MLRGVDHLVIGCGDPDAAARELEATVGLACTAGGRHDGLGTYNRIAWLADGSYLELIGVDDRDAAHEHPIGAAVMRTLDARGAGLATYALAADDLTGTVDARRAAGAAFGAPRRGMRRGADGELVEWSISVPDEPLRPDGIPFLIEHVLGGPEWGPAALAARAAFTHPLGSTVTLARLEIATDDPAAAVRRLHAELGEAVDAPATGREVRIGRHAVRFRRRDETVSDTAVVLAAGVREPRSAEAVGVRIQLMPIDGVA